MACVLLFWARIEWDADDEIEKRRSSREDEAILYCVGQTESGVDAKSLCHANGEQSVVVEKESHGSFLGTPDSPQANERHGKEKLGSHCRITTTARAGCARKYCSKQMLETDLA